MIVFVIKAFSVFGFISVEEMAGVEGVPCCQVIRSNPLRLLGWSQQDWNGGTLRGSEEQLGRLFTNVGPWGLERESAG